MLLDFVQIHEPVVVTLKSSDSPNVTPVPDPASESQIMALWNRGLLESLGRKLIQRPGGRDYYRIDDSLPTLDLSPSLLTEWNGHPALLQGRIYGLFEHPLSSYEKWYESIARWIRKRFTKSPLKLLDGYIGPEALEWFRKGGLLLPMFEPPATAEWLSFVESQHSTGCPTSS